MLVKHKETGKIYEVYDITYDANGYPCFLIYGYDELLGSEWIRMSAKHFIPYTEIRIRKELDMRDLIRANEEAKNDKDYGRLQLFL